MNPELTPQQIKEVLAGMISPDRTSRESAVKTLLAQEEAALPVLADLMSSAERTEAKAAKMAMEQMVHARLVPQVGKDRPDGGVRSRVADQLVQIARSAARPRATRAHALYLLGFSGVQRHERAIEALEKDKELGDDAHMARKRIQSVRY